MTYSEAMSRLTERDQDLIGLRDGGSKWKAIAEIHGISVNYAMVLYKKAKADVERLMAEPEQTPPDPLPAPAEATPEPRTMVVTGVPQRVAIVRGVPREEPIEMPQPLTAPWKKVELK